MPFFLYFMQRLSVSAGQHLLYVDMKQSGYLWCETSCYTKGTFYFLSKLSVLPGWWWTEYGTIIKKPPVLSSFIPLSCLHNGDLKRRLRLADSPWGLRVTRGLRGNGGRRFQTACCFPGRVPHADTEPWQLFPTISAERGHPHLHWNLRWRVWSQPKVVFN